MNPPIVAAIAIALTVGRNVPRLTTIDAFHLGYSATGVTIAAINPTKRTPNFVHNAIPLETFDVRIIAASRYVGDATSRTIAETILTKNLVYAVSKQI